jgi:PAS domain S-box-containing protein
MRAFVESLSVNGNGNGTGSQGCPDRRLVAALEELPDGVCVVDGEGRIVSVSARFCEITDYSAASLIGRTPPYPFWPQDAHESILPAFEQAMRERRGRYAVTFERSTGDRFPVTIDVTPLPYAGSNGFLAVVRDSSREVADRKLLREAHRVARLASWEWDPRTDRMRGSYELAAEAGIPPGELTLERLLGYVPDSHRERLRAQLAGLASGRISEIQLEHPVDVPSGRIGWLDLRAHAVRDGSGRVTVFGTTQDVTARKEAERALRESERRLSQAQRVAQLGSFEIDYRTDQATWSEEMYRLFGFDLGDQTDLPLRARQMLPEPDRERLRRVAEQVCADGEARTIEHRFTRTGELRWAETRLEPMVENGERLGVSGTLQDITARRAAEREIELQAHLLDAVDAAVIATDLDNKVTHWNAAATRLYGWTHAEAVGRSVVELTVGPEEAELAATIVNWVRRTGRWEGEFEARRKDGSTFPAYIKQSLYTGLDGEPAGLVGIAVDLSERVAVEHDLRAARDYLQAVTDSIGEGVFTVDTEGRLTYLNPAAERMLGWTLDEIKGQVMHEVTHYRRRDGSHYPVEACPLLKVRRSGVPVRVDEDIFIRRDGTELPVEYTSAPLDQTGGAVVVFSDISDRLAKDRRLERELESLSWIGRIRDALKHERFVIHAQPIVDIQTGNAIHHELLIRMCAEDGTIIPPGHFLPVAEEFAVIQDIDRWMLSQAVLLAASGVAVTVNLSAQSVGQRRLIDEFRKEIAVAGADPSLIIVELTETALLNDELEADWFVKGIRELGCRLALDDFGTGYGGFSYLKRLPVDFLKIDREFVRDLPENDASQHVVRAVVSLARGFGQRTIAEGVECEGALRMLRDLGVDYAQGFHIAKPKPIHEAITGGGSNGRPAIALPG